MVLMGETNLLDYFSGFAESAFCVVIQGVLLRTGWLFTSTGWRLLLVVKG